MENVYLRHFLYVFFVPNSFFSKGKRNRYFFYVFLNVVYSTEYIPN